MLQLYTQGKHAAGTPTDAAYMRECAFDAWIFRLRRHGLRLPAHHVHDPEPATILCIDRYDEPDRFVVRILHHGQLADFSGELHGARLVKQAKGCYQFTGDEWDAARMVHTKQTLVCAPTRERAHEILAKLGEQDLRRHHLR